MIIIPVSSFEIQTLYMSIVSKTVMDFVLFQGKVVIFLSSSGGKKKDHLAFNTHTHYYTCKMDMVRLLKGWIVNFDLL